MNTLHEQSSFRNIEIMWMVFFQVNELLLLLLPGSLRQSSCEGLQLQRICPSIIQ